MAKLYVLTCVEMQVDPTTGEPAPVEGTQRVIASTFRPEVQDAALRLFTEDARRSRATLVRDRTVTTSATDAILESATSPAAHAPTAEVPASVSDDPLGWILG